MHMTEIRSLGSIQGRLLLREIYRELRFDKQVSAFTILTTMWRLCTGERELQRFSSFDVRVLHPLGAVRGTSLWMEEVVNRFYYSTINSFVYFGAAVLLIMIGIRRFTEHVSDTAVLGSILFESFLLIVMFIVLFFSPPDSDEEEQNTGEDRSEVLREIGEIGRDYATVALRMEQAVDQLRDVHSAQMELVERVRQSTEAAHEALHPNPALLVSMEKTNETLRKFQTTVETLQSATERLHREEIDAAVRREVELLLSKRVSP